MRSAGILLGLLVLILGLGWVATLLADALGGEGWAVLVMGVVLGIGWLVYDASDLGCRRHFKGLPGGRFTRRGWKDGVQ